MPTVTLRYAITPGRPLVVEIPPEIESGEVEVRIHISEAPTAQAKKPIAEFLDEYSRRPARRTREEIDSALAEERSSWE